MIDSLTRRSPALETQDHVIRQSLLSALKRLGYAPLRHLNCRVKDGVVELSGSVSSFFMKQMAQTAAMRVERVREVRNLIQVAGGEQREAALTA